MHSTRRSDTIRADWRSFKASTTPTAAAASGHPHHPGRVPAPPARPSADHAKQLDRLAAQHNRPVVRRVSSCSGRTRTTSSASINTLESTTSLLLKYNPEYTCLLLGAKWFLDNGGYCEVWRRRRRPLDQLDAALLSATTLPRIPDNLPIVAAKGGPGGKPGCGSLPDAAQELAGPPDGDQHRLGHRHGHSAESRHRLPVLGQLSSR